MGRKRFDFNPKIVLISLSQQGYYYGFRCFINNQPFACCIGDMASPSKRQAMIVSWNDNTVSWYETDGVDGVSKLPYYYCGIS